MQNAASMDKALLAGIKKWFDQFLQWLTTHKYGIDEMNAANSDGTCWVMQVSAFAKFTGNDSLLKFCRDRYKKCFTAKPSGGRRKFPPGTAENKTLWIFHF